MCCGISQSSLDSFAATSSDPFAVSHRMSVKLQSSKHIENKIAQEKKEKTWKFAPTACHSGKWNQGLVRKERTVKPKPNILVVHEISPRTHSEVHPQTGVG